MMYLNRRLTSILLLGLVGILSCRTAYRENMTGAEMLSLDHSLAKLRIGMTPGQAINTLALPKEFIWSNLNMGDDNSLIIPIRFQDHSSLNLSFDGRNGEKGLRSWSKVGPAWLLDANDKKKAQ